MRSASSVDAVLLLKTYQEVAYPVGLLRNLCLALSSGANIAVNDGIDYLLVITAAK